MISKTPLLIATAIVASLSFTAFAPAAFADQGKGGMHRGERMESHQGDANRMDGRGMNGERGQGRGGMLQLACSKDGAARIEKMLDRVSERTTLTDEQKPLFEDFKTNALTAQTTFADTCIAPTRDGTGDMVTNLQNRKANMTAMIAALDTVLPSLEAFDASLTDAQKAELKPQHGDHGKRGDKRGYRR